MATLTFNGNSYTVDHAVKGPNYVHGYDANGNCVVSIDGVTDFSNIGYGGTYLSPDKCASESCNMVKYVDGMLVRSDGTSIGILKLVEGVHYGDSLPDPGNPGRIFFKRVT